MMDCSCRTAALRIFVKTIAQIQVPVRATPSRIAQHQARGLYSQPSRLYDRRPTSVLAKSSRAFHTSCVRNSAAEATQVAEGGSERPAKRDGADMTPRASAPATNASSEFERRDAHRGPAIFKPRNSADQKTQKKERWRSKPEPGGEWYQPKQKEPWMAQKNTLKKKFPDGWNPRKKLSPDALVGIRMLHKQFPEEYTTEVLAQKFEVSAEAIRRILRSKWTPDADKEIERQDRWFNRGKKVWSHWAALGKKPPRKWRAEGIVRDPIWNTPKGPNNKDKTERAEAQRRLAKAMMG